MTFNHCLTAKDIERGGVGQQGRQDARGLRGQEHEDVGQHRDLHDGVHEGPEDDRGLVR